MKLENQVCSLDLSKKLKELGVKQRSYFVWELFDICPPKLQTATDVRLEQADYYSAFTVAELGEMLPNYVATCNCGGGRNSGRVDYAVYSNINSREAWIKGVTKEINWVTLRDKTEANARAKMFVYLLENKLMKEMI